ncbi:putative defensin, plant [Medicago truncatula]|uniref:Putative defensin, plant n=1 Tax=Medicago truncatula TaxID=3880 RepID=A0A396IPP8_MEDTR|nr:putative defensin, plant [Medicago truncatula]
MRSLTSYIQFVDFMIWAEMQPTHVEEPEARTCDSQSHSFKGVCWIKHNCANVCKTEGFTGGHCHGFRRRCFCSKPC